jgi:hypothetical protein
MTRRSTGRGLGLTERGLGLTGRVWSIAAAAEARMLGFCTGASDHSGTSTSGQALKGSVDRVVDRTR